MVREDILEGLRSAVSRGEPLKQAMITFYNAGYKREEIQEAAQAMQENQLTQGIQPQEKAQQPVAQTTTGKEPEKTKEVKEGKTKQRASKYGKKKKPGTALIIVLAIFLALLIGVLSLIFIFRGQLTDILNKLI